MSRRLPFKSAHRYFKMEQNINQNNKRKKNKHRNIYKIGGHFRNVKL